MNYDTLSRKVSMSDPDMGNWSYTYDPNGNLETQTDANIHTIIFQYDELNRIIKKDYPTGTDIQYYYDQPYGQSCVEYNLIGRLSKVTDDSGEEKYCYNRSGNTGKTIKTINGVDDYAIETEYDELGRVDSIRYPGNDQYLVYYLYDAGGNISEVPGFATYSGYNALGQPGTVTYDNEVTTTYSYYQPTDHPEWLNRLKAIKTGTEVDPEHDNLQNLTYTYYSNGNIASITDANDGSRSQTFTYDHLDRLTDATSTAYGHIEYRYDKIGNMEYNSQVGNYTYWKQVYGTKPHAVYQAGSNTYGYDANGNMTSAPGKTLTYNYDNMPSSINSTTFVYDYSGQRVKKNSTIYIGKLYECTGSACKKYIFAGSNRIALKTSSYTYYYHTDHLGSSSIMTDAYGNGQGEYHYYPYGGTRISSGLSIKHKFTGQELDDETGLYYYGARYYDPALGRFVSADSIVPDPSNPQSLNRYTYVLNNPLRYTDPTGHGFWDKILGAVEIVVGAVATAVPGPWQYVGPAIMAHGVYNIDHNANIDMRAQTPVASWGDSGGSGGFNYIGTGSTTYSNYGGTININQPPTSTGGSSFTDRYSQWNNVVTVNPEILTGNYYSEEQIYPNGYFTFHKSAFYSGNNSAGGGGVDGFGVILGGTSSAAAIVSLAAPPGPIKATATAIGAVATGISIGRSIYQFTQGKSRGGDLVLKISLDVAPLVVPWVGKKLGNEIGQAIGEGIRDVVEHQKGILDINEAIFSE